MGNRKRASGPDYHARPKPMPPPKVGAGSGGGVVIDQLPEDSWRFLLEDATPAASSLTAGSTVRGELTAPRVSIYLGDTLLGFASLRISARILKAVGSQGGVLLGQVTKVDSASGRVTVVLSLQGR